MRVLKAITRDKKRAGYLIEYNNMELALPTAILYTNKYLARLVRSGYRVFDMDGDIEDSSGKPIKSLPKMNWKDLDSNSKIEWITAEDIADRTRVTEEQFEEYKSEHKPDTFSYENYKRVTQGTEEHSKEECSTPVSHDEVSDVQNAPATESNHVNLFVASSADVESYLKGTLYDGIEQSEKVSGEKHLDSEPITEPEMEQYTMIESGNGTLILDTADDTSSEPEQEEVTPIDEVPAVEEVITAEPETSEPEIIEEIDGTTEAEEPVETVTEESTEQEVEESTEQEVEEEHAEQEIVEERAETSEELTNPYIVNMTPYSEEINPLEESISAPIHKEDEPTEIEELEEPEVLEEIEDTEQEEQEEIHYSEESDETEDQKQQEESDNQVDDEEDETGSDDVVLNDALKELLHSAATLGESNEDEKEEVAKQSEPEEQSVEEVEETESETTEVTEYVEETPMSVIEAFVNNAKTRDSETLENQTALMFATDVTSNPTDGALGHVKSKLIDNGKLVGITIDVDGLKAVPLSLLYDPMVMKAAIKAGVKYNDIHGDIALPDGRIMKDLPYRDFSGFGKFDFTESSSDIEEWFYFWCMDEAKKIDSQDTINLQKKILSLGKLSGVYVRINDTYKTLYIKELMSPEILSILINHGYTVEKGYKFTLPDGSSLDALPEMSSIIVNVNDFNESGKRATELEKEFMRRVEDEINA